MGVIILHAKGKYFNYQNLNWLMILLSELPPISLCLMTEPLSAGPTWSSDSSQLQLVLDSVTLEGYKAELT